MINNESLNGLLNKLLYKLVIDCLTAAIKIQTINFLIKPPFVHHHDVHYIVGLTSASAHLAWKWLPWLSQEVAMSEKSNELSHNHQNQAKNNENLKPTFQ